MSDVHGGPSPQAVRTSRLEEALVARGLVETNQLDAIIDEHVSARNPDAGARVVARAWTDDEFRRRLLDDADGALQELGLGWAFNFQSTRRFQVIENTETTHNVIVCTLCSCYPTALLGPPPGWYKSDSYRARVVLEPRAVLAEFGLRLDPEVELRVWDSTAETRYMVMPRRPPGTEGLGLDQLAALISRDALVGVALAREPADASG